jgi:hypothetical protein
MTKGNAKRRFAAFSKETLVEALYIWERAGGFVPTPRVAEILVHLCERLEKANAWRRAGERVEKSWQAYDRAHSALESRMKRRALSASKYRRLAEATDRALRRYKAAVKGQKRLAAKLDALPIPQGPNGDPALSAVPAIGTGESNERRASI